MPTRIIFSHVGIDDLLLGHVFRQQVENRLLERAVTRVHALVEGDALLGRVAVVVVFDVGVSATYTNHAFLAPNRHLLDFSANQITILFLKFRNGHESPK